jgi:hypothetical protein
MAACNLLATSSRALYQLLIIVYLQVEPLEA